MKAWQQRAVDEKSELDERRKRLDDFLSTETYLAMDAQDQSLLLRQSFIMADYSRILGLRIAKFS